MVQGVFYVATGDEWIKEAVVSAQSLRQHMPDIHISLYTNSDVNEPSFSTIEKISLPPGDRRIETLARRIELMLEMPWERTLRLDTDTFILGKLSPIFAVLDEFDIAAVHGGTRVSLPQPDNDVPETFPEYCASFVAFKKSDKVKRFIETWAMKFREFVAWAERQETLPPHICSYHADNASLRWALYHSGLRLATLTGEWNCVAHAGYVNGKVRIVHARGMRLEKMKAINNRLGGRLYAHGEIVWPDSMQT